MQYDDLKKILYMKIFINSEPPLFGTNNCPEIIVYTVKNQQNLNMFEYIYSKIAAM